MNRNNNVVKDHINSAASVLRLHESDESEEAVERAGLTQRLKEKYDRAAGEQMLEIAELFAALRLCVMLVFADPGCNTSVVLGRCANVNSLESLKILGESLAPGAESMAIPAESLDRAVGVRKLRSQVP